MAEQSDIDRIFFFLHDVRKLQTIYRQTKKHDNNFESDAEHSWSVALLCMLLVDRIKKELQIEVDELKIMKMTLVHDLGEIVIGDAATWDTKARIGKEQKEEEAVKKLTEVLPEDLKEEIRSLCYECEEKKTIEAIIVKSIDRLDPALNRVVSGQGWKDVQADESTREALDERQLPRHEFSKVVTQLYEKVRSEAISKGMFGEK